MKSARSSAKKNNVAQKSRKKAATVSKYDAREVATSAFNPMVVLNSSWNEDEFELRFSGESGKSNSQSPCRKVCALNNDINTSSVKDQLMNAKVVLEKLSEISLSRWMKPRKELKAKRNINSVDDFSKRTKRYCIKCVEIIADTSNNDDEPCRKCNATLLYHCVKCGAKLMTYQDISRHLEKKCNSRKSRA